MQNFIKVVVILVITMVYVNCGDDAEESIIILPSNFEGPVLILYDQTDGIIPYIENQKYVYKIPSSGLLKTKLKAKFKVKGHEYYYQNNNGLIEKTITNISLNAKNENVNIDKNETYVFSEEMGTTPYNAKFRVFVIGKYFHKDSLLDLKDRFIINQTK